MSQKHEVAEQLGKITLAAGGWLGAVQLANVQIIVSIISGVAVAVYTLVNLYVLWRDKIQRDKQ